MSTGGMNPDNFTFLNDVERGNFWFEPRNKLIVGLLDRYLPDAKSFLEIGCGTGFVLSSIAKSRQWGSLNGSELHEEGLTFAKARLGDEANLIQLDARYLSNQRLYDAVGAFDVIEHIVEDEGVLSGLRKALNRSGGLILTVPQHHWLWSDIDVKSHHVRRYTSGELREKIERAGFRIVFSSSYTTLLLPLMYIHRFRKQKVDDGLAATSTEFSLPWWLNAAFRAILSFEVFFTLLGVRWPVGGSRVIVARAI